MSRTMVRLIQSFGTLESAPNSTFDLDEAPSPYGAFTKRYRATYPAQVGADPLGYQLSEQEMRELEAGGLSGSTAAAATTATRPTSPGLLGALAGTPDSSTAAFLLTSLPAIGDRGGGDGGSSLAGGSTVATNDSTAENAPGARGKLAKKQETGPETIYGLNPPKLTVLNMLDFALECYGMLWQVLARNGNESLASVTQRFCSKKRLSQRSNDFKLMGFLHFYCEGTSGGGTREAQAQLESSPHLILFGKCVGLLPRRQKTVRKAWGALAVSVLAFAHIEKCWRTAELIDAEGAPSPADFKAKLTRLSQNKSLPVRRAIRLVLLLGECCQPHWTMAPVASASKEYNSRQPWDAESVSRLLHLLLFAAQWVNGNKPASEAEQQQQHQQLQHHQQHHQQHQAASAREGRDARDHRETNRRRDEEEVPDVSLKLLRALTAKAKELWSARAFTAPLPVQMDDVARINSGTFVHLSTERAAELAGRMHMGACELALVCIDAWEAEYRALQRDMRKALVSTTRRTGVLGTYDSSNASLSRVERLAVVRLLRWHNEMDHPGIDWASIKARSQESNIKIYPFHVPATLLEKTVAELNFHATRVTSEYERERAQEYVEDLVAASGPYARTPQRTPLGRSRGAGAGVSAWGGDDEEGDEESDVVMDAAEILASRRQDYLAAQTLGDDASDEHKGGDGGGAGDYHESQSPSRKFTRPNSAAVPLPLSGPADDDWVADGAESPDERLSRRFLRDAHELQQAASRPPSSHAEDPRGIYASQRPRPPILQPLSTVPYSSPLPARHVLSLVDLLDNDAALLEKVRLLSAVPVGPGTGKARLRSLDDELFGDLESDSGSRGAREPSPRAAQPSIAGNEAAAKQLVDQQAAKQRVWAQMEADRRRKADVEAAARAARLEERKERTRRAAEEPLLPRTDAFAANKLDVRSALDLTGKKASGYDAASVQSALAKEQTVQLLQLTDVSGPLPGAISIEITESFLKPFQLEVLRKVDFTRAQLGPVGATAVARALSRRCLLLDLRLGGCGIGDTACLRLLQAVAAGGGAPHLVVLDLSSNNLTMHTEGLAGLGALQHLRHLDLSSNKLTLDLPRHHRTLAAALAPLHALEALSLAHNNIQDVGFAVLCSLLLAPSTLSRVAFLDLRSCFLTPLSFDALVRLVKEASPRAWVPAGVQLQGNIFKVEQKTELAYVAHVRDLPLHFSGEAEVLLFDAMACPYTCEPDVVGSVNDVASV